MTPKIANLKVCESFDVLVWVRADHAHGNDHRHDDGALLPHKRLILARIVHLLL